MVPRRLGLGRPPRRRRRGLVTNVTGVENCRAHGEIFVAPPDYAILNPVAPGRANLSLVVPLEHVTPWTARLETFFTARARHLPHLARRLSGARLVAPVRAMAPLAYEVLAPRVGGVVLLGHAACFFDPFPGDWV